MAMAAALEARGGLAGGREREGRGLGWWRTVWGCSPREESDQDGLGEEIDDALFFS